MSIEDRIREQFEQSLSVKRAALAAMAGPIARASAIMAASLEAGGKVLACGNGGSAADAQHFAGELIGRFEIERRALAAVALTTDSSVLTCVANDYSYDDVFARQVSGLGRRGDVLLAISTSGNSPNVLKAVQVAQQAGMTVVALTGKGGGKMTPQLRTEDVSLCVPADRTTRIQEVHLLTLHCLCDAIDHLLIGESA